MEDTPLSPKWLIQNISLGAVDRILIPLLAVVDGFLEGWIITLISAAGAK